MENAISVLLMFLPLILIALLVNVSEQRRLARFDTSQKQPEDVLKGAEATTVDAASTSDSPGLATSIVSYGCMTIMMGFTLIGGLVFFFASNTPVFSEAMSSTGVAFESPMMMANGMWISALLGLLVLLKPVRRLLANLMPINPDSHVHAIALSMAMLIPMMSFVTSGIGLGAIADTLEGVEQSEAALLASLWGQQLMTALLALVGVGYLLRRSPGKMWQRLGITRISLRQLLMGIGIALVISFLVNVVAIPAENNGWISEDVARLTELLLGGAFETWYGILTIGVAAALGEEMLFRGALQPVFGIIPATLLFVLAHSQYGFGFATLITIVVGFVLAIIRQRHNTTMAMVVHAVYNSSLVFTAQLAEMLF